MHRFPTFQTERNRKRREIQTLRRNKKSVISNQTLLPSPDHLRRNPDRIPEAVEISLQRIEDCRELNAFVSVLAARARSKSQDLAEALKSGKTLPLAGWLIAVKDNIAVSGERLTCASRMLDGFVPTYSATVVEKLESAGAVIIGKTNLDEFAMGSSSEYSFFGPVKHPEQPDRVAGGSSGGSAAAVGARCVHGALGSDTGGSVRQPASFCGVCALKPTYGRVSRYGLVTYASSLEQISPIALDCRGLRELLEIMNGPDPRDSTSVDVPFSGQSVPDQDKSPRLRIGIPTEYLSACTDGSITESIELITERLSNSGHKAVKVSLPHTKYAVPAYYILATAEASSNLARFDGVRYGYRSSDAHEVNDLYSRSRTEGFGTEVKRRIMMGTYALSAGYYDAYYKKAQKVRRLIRADFTDAFREVDVLLAPVSPTTAFKRGEKTADPLTMYLSDVFTVPANLAGIPSLSVPVGRDSSTLPIGLQIIGQPFAEEQLLELGTEIESFKVVS